MAGNKIEKPQPEVSDATDTAEAYTEKATLSEHDLELEQALANYAPDSPEEKALVPYIDRQNIAISLPAEKSVVAVALVSSAGNLSAVYGGRLCPSSDGPRFVKGFAVTGAFTGFGNTLAALIPLIFSHLTKEGNTKVEMEILGRE
ncbi:allantoate permease [Colletotrichum orchidophilum]|uniref:Allantoate permease n=1 Tax=Colletotrichum orchidophilum TaxID=1209926 RepID=A0A1G4BLS6_9PEZI|nr:allantoate permease [Colletotrichum orchidophilum]OHF02364.1 allantoate permease [Colletotrichum orchidophilum]